MPTAPSAFGLCLLSLIQDKKDYPQIHIIFKMSRITFNHKAVPPYFEDNKLA
jgi:hypothetical protein